MRQLFWMLILQVGELFLSASLDIRNPPVSSLLGLWREGEREEKKKNKKEECNVIKHKMHAAHPIAVNTHAVVVYQLDTLVYYFRKGQWSQTKLVHEVGLE